jgi:hypothetical protein
MLSLDSYLNLFVSLSPAIVLVLLVSLGIWLARTHPVSDRLNQAFTLFGLLVGLVVMNTLHHLDGVGQQGCFPVPTPQRPWQEIAFGVISIGLLSAGYFARLHRLQIGILIAELLLYMGKTHYFEMDYSSGFGVNEFAVQFDFIAIALRLALIRKMNLVQIKTYWIWITAFIILFFNLVFLGY